MSTQEAAEFIKESESRSLGQEALDQYRDQVIFLAQQYNRCTVAEVAGDIAATNSSLFGLIGQGRRRPGELRELYFDAAISSILMAQIAYDLGRMFDSLTLSRAAFVCAQNAGHTGLQTWARAQQAITTYQSGRLREALRYVDSAIEVSKNLRGTLRPWVYAIRSRILAQMAAPVDAMRMLEASRSARSSVQNDDLDIIGGILTFPIAAQAYYYTGTLAYVPEVLDEAEEQAELSLSLYSDRFSPDWSYVQELGTRTELALARVNNGQADSALDSLAPLFDLPIEQRIAGLYETVGRVLKSARQNSAVSTTRSGTELIVESMHFLEAPRLKVLT